MKPCCVDRFRWWHCVLNLKDTVAVTQNYCGRCNFASVWKCVRTERPCWSTRWLAAMPSELRDRANEIDKNDCFDKLQVLELSLQSRQRKLERRNQRALKRARERRGEAFDEAMWWEDRTEKLETEKSLLGHSSTASTTSLSNQGMTSDEESSDSDCCGGLG